MREETVSNLSHGFLENALWHLSKATNTYKKNCNNHRNTYGHRSLIAVSENRHAAASLLNFYTAIEFIITTECFRKGIQNFNSEDNVIYKARKLGIYSEEILQALTELSTPRDSISHAYLWKTQRTLDQDYNIVRVDDAMWEKYLCKLKPKYKKNVDLKHGVTMKFEFNIVPDKIDFLDGVKCLFIINEIYMGILKKSNTSWRPQFYPYKQEGFSVEIQAALSKKYDLENWLKFFIRQLYWKDNDELKSLVEKLS